MVRCATGLGLSSDCAWVDFVQWPTPSDWNSISYVYDPGGRRIEKKYDGQAVMKYLYDGDQIIAEYDATGDLRGSALKLTISGLCAGLWRRRVGIDLSRSGR